MKTGLNTATSIFIIALLTFSLGSSLTWSSHTIGYTVASALGAVIPPTLEWNATFGLGYYNTAHQIIQTQDGGYVITGMYGRSNPLNVTLIKLDPNGNLQWNQSYDLQFINCPMNNALLQGNDSGYTIIGNKFHTLTLTLIKTDSEGKILWSQTYSSNYLAKGITQTNDGGYLITGTTSMHSIETHPQAVLIKTDESGKTQWIKTITSGTFNSVNDAENYVVVCGNRIVKVDISGNIIWDKELPPVLPSDPQQYRYSLNAINVMTKSVDGGYALAGYALNRNLANEETSLMLLIKTDATGTIQWNKTYGKSGQGYIYSLVQTSDNSYALAGSAFNDMVLIKTDSDGNEQWNQTFGGNNSTDIAYSIIETIDGGFALAGQTKPGTTFNESYYYIVKTTSVSPHINPIASSSIEIPALPLEILVTIVAILTTTICIIILALVKTNRGNSSKQQV